MHMTNRCGSCRISATPPFHASFERTVITIHTKIHISRFVEKMLKNSSGSFTLIFQCCVTIYEFDVIEFYSYSIFSSPEPKAPGELIV